MIIFAKKVKNADFTNNPLFSACNPNNPRHNGFTLLETLIVIAIIGILAAFSVPYYYSFQVSSKFNSTTSEIVQTLRRAQSRAMAAEGGEPFGVHFEAKKFVLFQGDSYDAGDSDNDVFNLSGLEIYNITLNNNEDNDNNVVFNELDGNTDNSGSVSLKTSNDDMSGTISVSQEGTVTY